ATELPVVRRIEGLGKRIDVRAFLRDAVALEGAEVLERAGIVGDLVALAVDVEIRGSGGVKVSEVVEVLGGTDLGHRAVRAFLGMRSPEGAILSPTDLDAVRALRRAPAEVVSAPWASENAGPSAS